MGEAKRRREAIARGEPDWGLKGYRSPTKSHMNRPGRAERRRVLVEAFRSLFGFGRRAP